MSDVKHKVCCESFAKLLGTSGGKSPLAVGYAGQFGSTRQVDLEADGTYNIAGCCGGGCYVVEDARFCMFCGAEIAKWEIEQ